MIKLCTDIWDGFKSQPGRVGLSIVAITAGSIALTILISTLSALSDTSRNLIKEFGINVIAVVSAPSTTDQYHSGLTSQHARLIRSNFPRSDVSTILHSRATTLGTDALLNVVATNELLDDIRKWRPVDGRFLDKTDVDQQRRHAVISNSLSKDWGWSVGNVILLKNVPFIVVGIINVAGDALDGEFGDSNLLLGERLVFVPYTVSPLWADNKPEWGNNVDVMFVSSPDPSSGMVDKLTNSLRSILKQPDLASGQLSWITSQSLISDVTGLQKTIALTVGTISMLCLILGGTTLMSLMVANIRERVTEIGLRRALGATRMSIAQLFVVEAVITTMIGGLAGTVIAHILINVTDGIWNIPIQINLMTWLGPTTVAILFGMLFAYGPAKQAAMINPADALRYE